ncbi:hypothetical protein ACFL09_06815, partial [Planctomycetota bacterium]
PLRGAPLGRLELPSTAVRDLTPVAGMKLKEFVPPPRKQLTPESLKVIEDLEKQGCQVTWQE